MKTVGCVKWLETVMNNWVIKWQNEQNMWDFDKPFPLSQWVSVRLGTSQYGSLGCHSGFTPHQCSPLRGSGGRVTPSEMPPGGEPGQASGMAHCFSPLLFIMSCVCVCVCVCELPPTAVHVWDGASRPGHIFSIHSQWWCLSVEGGCCQDTAFGVVGLGWPCLPWVAHTAWAVHPGGALRHHHCIWTVSDSAFLHLPPAPCHGAPVCP